MEAHEPCRLFRWRRKCVNACTIHLHVRSTWLENRSRWSHGNFIPVPPAWGRQFFPAKLHASSDGIIPQKPDISALDPCHCCTTMARTSTYRRYHGPMFIHTHLIILSDLFTKQKCINIGPQWPILFFPRTLLTAWVSLLDCVYPGQSPAVHGCVYPD